MVRREAELWLEEAKADLGRARRALEYGDHALSAFMSQQACEKALRAAHLALARALHPKTHDLTALYQRVESLLRLPEEVAEASRKYPSTTRPPGTRTPA